MNATRPCFHIGTFWEQGYIAAPSLWQFTLLLYTCGHNCEQNDPHPQLSTFNDLLEWMTSLKWCSSSPSSPVHSQPSLLCVHNTCSWLRERLRLLFGYSSKFSSLHVGQALCSSWSRSLHVWQKWVPQQLVKYGFRSIRLHIGHSVWNTLVGGSTNSQSYPPNIFFCCGLPWGSAPPSASRGVLVGGVFFCWASSASCVCTTIS